MAPNANMTFWDRLSMYLDAVGVQDCGTAWDLAGAPMDDASHREFAYLLAGGDPSE